MGEYDPEVQEWLDSDEYLPTFMRDFHDQKDLFKYMHSAYRGQADVGTHNWIDGHTYVIDWFLWFMASRGYTLQKSRKKLDFEQLP